MTRALALIIAVAFAAAQTTTPSTVTGEWPTYGGDLANSKYSPLDEITAANFATLRPAWRAQSPDAFLA
jgi:quinoprotein glucose dehydrogenase